MPRPVDTPPPRSVAAPGARASTPAIPFQALGDRGRWQPGVTGPLLLAAAVALAAFPGRVACATGPQANATVAELIARLGAEDFHDRESAAASLRAIGPAAIDDLLAAAETSDDLEVSLRARWLVDTIPLDMPHDPPAVVNLLSTYKKGKLTDRIVVLQRLIQLDDDAGIEAVARIVRLDRSTSCSRAAAALLAREWYPDDPGFGGMIPRIRTGLGASSRPTAALLRGRIDALAPDAARRQLGRDAAAAAHAALARSAEAVAGRRVVAADDVEDRPVDLEAGTSEETQRIFDRARVRLLVAAGRRDEAIAAAGPLVSTPLADRGLTPQRAAMHAADTLAWCVEQGLPEVVDALKAIPPAPWLRDQPLLGLAMAHAERARGRAEIATTLAEQTLEAIIAAGHDRLPIATRLARWGCADWATRVYDSIVDDPGQSLVERIFAAILYSEFLHDQGRDGDAARRLGEILERRDGQTDVDDVLRRLSRDQRTVRSRKLYFESCVADARGDTAERRRLVEESLASQGKDVDSLIALYRLTDNTPAQLAEAVERVEEALRQIDNEIQATPDDANGYNEYAWLVSNTEGDLEKATRYSRISLDKSFDNSSYLDTLAHCRAAGGDYDGAVRWQTRAQRQEPGSLTIRRNLDRFRRMATTRGAP